MPIYPTHKAIFVHIPKNGGTTITTLLKRDRFLGRKTNLPNDHTGGVENIAELRELLGSEADEYFSFGFVRNPWDRFVSAYHYVCQRRPHMTSVTSHDGFSEFVSAFASDPEEYMKIRYFRPQISYLGNSEGLLPIDFVGRFENFESDLKSVLDRLGIRRKLMRHRKKTARADYRQYYTAKERGAVAEAYARDVEYFDYKFGDGGERKKSLFLKLLK